MEQSDQPVPAPKKPKPPSLGDRLLRIAAFPVAAVSGFWVTYTNVRASTIERARPLPGQKKINQHYLDELIHDSELRDNRLISAEEFAKRAATNKAAQSEAINGHLADLGFTGFKNKWNFINKASRQKAAIEGLTVAGIAVGAILTIANTKSVEKFLLGDSQGNEKER